VVLGLTEWSPGGQAPTVYDVSDPASWDSLISDYAHPAASIPLRRIFEIARAHGVVCVVKEPRYIDADWRSQLARFYNGAFRRYPSVCHRLHFFTRPVDPDVFDLSGLQDAYRGYTILRPLPVAPVGRTMIVPPPDLDDAVRCEGEETVDLFGWAFTVRAMPFISQDTQLLRCAHAALWMVLRHGSLVHGQPQRLPAEIYDAALGGVVVGRQLPSDGLSAYQLISAMATLGLSPTGKKLPETRQEEDAAQGLRLYGMVCRYINSRLPPVIISTTHAWTMVAYRRVPSAGNPVIQLWRHDDARGPYLLADDPWNELEEAHKPWLTAYLPLLPKAYLDAERAEAVGRSWIDIYRASPVSAGSTLLEADARPDSLERATLRTFLVESTFFKQHLGSRGMPDALASVLRRTPMSRYIWVIEVVDRRERAAGRDDVMGEVLLDATLTQFEPLDDPTAILALHVDDFAFVTGVDGAPSATIPLPKGSLYASGCPPLT
jgi:hypothetical protein